ncbi:sugar kinase [Texcoconibacillus texcoconensis]|uniref:2-dehydro-3-deoxygluconokinase n=1 Tax=Texcoconibacillus texcoconensis TaxID=1095777 RepID=A0A840QQW0_9BACI|nr:sugar kinase [Texcoconibacillus texcoconensis]MBB5173836.1 2-dehydro-3-deoxygluconokinase [Texcoconibacillus texcoconensis]
MQSPDVITVGETMVILNPDQSIPLEYAHSFSKQVGGAESNLAVGLSRLGHSVGWISRLGHDPFGRYIQQVIRGEGVDVSNTSFDDEAPTGVFFKERKFGDAVNVYYYRANSAASRLQKEHVSEAYISGAKYVVISGILPALSQSCYETTEEVIRIAQKYEIPIVFDPNLRLKLWKDKEEAASVLNSIAARSDFILTGQSEGYQLTGTHDPEEIAAFYKQKSPQATVIVKLGADGAYYSYGSENGYVPGFPVSKVVDPIGAGDSFCAGFISAQLDGSDIHESIKKGNAAGAVTVQISGDMEGFPRPSELEQMLQSTDEENGGVYEEVNR